MFKVVETTLSDDQGHEWQLHSKKFATCLETMTQGQKDLVEKAYKDDHPMKETASFCEYIVGIDETLKENGKALNTSDIL